MNVDWLKFIDLDRCALDLRAGLGHHPADPGSSSMTHSDQTDIHGQRKTYMRGCRCAPCKAAAAAYRKRWAAETGAEKRVGKRGEQKRAYEARVRELR